LVARNAPFIATGRNAIAPTSTLVARLTADEETALELPSLLDPNPVRPTCLRVLSVLVAGTFTVSGCMTTVAVSPASVAASAGLAEDKESKLQSSEGWETVNGSTRITLRSTEDETATVNEAPLSLMRSEGGTLVLPGNGHSLALKRILSAEVDADPASPEGLAAVAGLADKGQATIPGGTYGNRVVYGSSKVSLRSGEGDTETVNELRLSALRSEGGALVLPGDSHRVAIDHVWSAEISKPAPGQTVGLVAGIVLGTVSLGVAVYFIASWISFVNTCDNALAAHDESRTRIHR
jgi:hypothetical protein